VHDNKLARCIHGRPECLMNLSVAEVERAGLALARSTVEFDAVPRHRVHG
jgi:hypothetical protein